MTKQNHEYLHSVLETSRVVNHDLLGIVHVIDFCIEELSLLDHSDSNAFVERIGRSVDQIKSIVEGYSNFLKSIDSESYVSVDVGTCLQQIVDLGSEWLF